VCVAGPGSAGRLESAGAELTIPPDALLEPEAIRIGRTRAAETPGLRVLSGPVRIDPEDLLLDKALTIRFAASPADSVTHRVGIYRLDEAHDSWGFAGAEGSARGVETTIRRMGVYALIEDIAAPRVVRTLPAPGGRLPGGPGAVLEAVVAEIGRGLGPDGVEFLLDGAAVPSEYDPDRGGRARTRCRRCARGCTRSPFAQRISRGTSRKPFS